MQASGIEQLYQTLSKAGSLICAIVQDRTSKDLLMVAWMNREALDKTLATHQATFWSRSREELWTKGEISGNTMHVVEARFDCDADAILLLVDPAGPACHTGSSSCFFQNIDISASKHSNP